MNLAFQMNGKEYVALGWQSESQLWIAEITVQGVENKAYLGDPEIMYFRDFIAALTHGKLHISDTLPVLT